MADVDQRCGVMVVREGRIVFINPPPDADLVYPAQELAGMPLATVMSAAAIAAIDRNFAAGSPRDPQALSLSTHLRGEGDRQVPVDLVATVTDWEGAPALMILFRDTTEQRRIEAHLRQVSEQLAILMDSIPVSVFKCEAGAGFHLLFINETIGSITGYPRSRFLAQPAFWLTQVHDDDRIELRRKLGEATTERSEHQTLRWRRAGGDYRWMAIDFRIVQPAPGARRYIVGVWQDVHMRVVETARIRQMSRALEQTADMVFITDRQARIIYVNPAFVAVTGYSNAETLGRSPSLLKSSQHDHEFYRNMRLTLERGEVFRDVVINRKKDGTLFYEEKTITPLRNGHGRITHYVSTGKDITKRMLLEERLHYLAYHDVMTDLPNRTLFMDRLGQALVRRRETKRWIAVMYLDLDGFKAVNDSLGHNVGDALLKEIAICLRNCVREGDTVARLSGDEFAIMLDGVTAAEDVPNVAKKILAALVRPTAIGEHRLYVTTSIGISLFPDDSSDPETLLKYADVAMYRAKEQGRNNYQFYSHDIGEKVFKQLGVEASLRGALARKEFEVYYQPLVDPEHGQVEAVESLARWRHPTLGWIGPNEFVPILEKMGQMTETGNWMLHAVCQRTRPWLGEETCKLRVIINLSPRQLKDSELAQRFGEILEEEGYAPRCLTVEIAETILERQDYTVQANLAAFKRLGMEISIDNFGGRYTSLAYMKHIPADVIKIDRSLIAGIDAMDDDRVLVGAIIAMAKQRQIQVVGKGVETQSQLNFLRDQGCDLVQGYLLSPPLPATEVGRLLARGVPLYPMH